MAALIWAYENQRSHGSGGGRRYMTEEELERQRKYDEEKSERERQYEHGMEILEKGDKVCDLIERMVTEILEKNFNDVDKDSLGNKIPRLIIMTQSNKDEDALKRKFRKNSDPMDHKHMFKERLLALKPYAFGQTLGHWTTNTYRFEEFMKIRLDDMESEEDGEMKLYFWGDSNPLTGRFADFFSKNQEERKATGQSLYDQMEPLLKISVQKLLDEFHRATATAMQWHSMLQLLTVLENINN